MTVIRELDNNVQGLTDSWPGDFAVVYDDACQISPGSPHQIIDAFFDAEGRLDERYASIVTEITGKSGYDWQEFMTRPIEIDADEASLRFTSAEAERLYGIVKKSAQEGYKFGKSLLPGICEVSVDG